MRFLVTICIVFTCFSLSAQDKIGFETGLSISNLRGDVPSGRKSIASINLGGLYEHSFSNSIGIKALVSYERKGYSYEFFDDIGVFNPVIEGMTKQKSFTQYLTIAPLMKYTTNGSIAFFVNVGPYVGVVLKKQSFARSTDFGMISGLGLQKTFGNVVVSLEGRNSYGLINTYTSTLGIEQDIKTIAFYALIGAAFEI